MVIGGMLLLSPVIAFLGSTISVHRTFALAASGELELTEQSFIRNIDFALYILAAGPIGFICGVVIFAFSIIYFIRAGRTVQPEAISTFNEPRNGV